MDDDLINKIEKTIFYIPAQNWKEDRDGFNTVHSGVRIYLKVYVSRITGQASYSCQLEPADIQAPVLTLDSTEATIKRMYERIKHKKKELASEEKAKKLQQLTQHWFCESSNQLSE